MTSLFGGARVQIQAEHNAARGIIYVEGTERVIFELERPQGENWPTDINIDEVYHSLDVLSTIRPHRLLSQQRQGYEEH